MKNKYQDSKYLKKFGICEKKSGQNVLYQTKHITEEELDEIRKDSEQIIFLFGDNEKDYLRDKRKEDRLGMAGQAKVAGQLKYEDKLCFGVVTLWHWTRDLDKKTIVWENTFKKLLDKVNQGYTIVVPAPSPDDLDRHHHKFFGKNNQQVIFHNLGTGIADASAEELSVLQNFLDNLEMKRLSREPYFDVERNFRQQGCRPSGERINEGYRGEEQKDRTSENVSTNSVHTDDSKKNMERMISELKDMYVTSLKDLHNEKQKNEKLQQEMFLIKSENERLKKHNDSRLKAWT